MKRCVSIATVLIIVLTIVSSVFSSIGGKVAREIIEETVERTAMRSGTEMVGDLAGKSAAETLERLVKVYGNNVRKVVDDAGIELLQAVPRYGDEIVKYAMKASPPARRAFARNIPELLPLVRRVGVDGLELEAKTPGLSVRLFEVFGDDAGRALARNVPAEDIPRLLKYAVKADCPATRKVLLETYKKEGRSLFERIPPGLVIATGLSTSMLYATHELTGPVRSISDAVSNRPDITEAAVRGFLDRLLLWGTVIVLVIVFLLFWRYGLMPWHRKRPLATTTSCRETKRW